MYSYRSRRPCGALDFELRAVGQPRRSTTSGAPPPRADMLEAQELFAFDVRGFIILRGGAEAALAKAAAGDHDAAAAVLASPLLRQAVSALVNPGSAEGEGVVIDAPPELLPQVEPGRDERVIEDGSSGDERRWVARVGSDSVVRYAQGLRVVVALCDCPAGAGGLHLVPASHNSSLPTAPTELLSGALPELWHQPTLAAGDCVLMASNLVASLRPWTLPVSSAPQRLLHCEFIPPQTRPAAGIPPAGPSEPWHELLTPLEKALCGVEGLDDSTPVVISDGTKAWLSPALPSWEAYLEAGGMEPDPVELYRWDLEVRDWGLDRLID